MSLGSRRQFAGSCKSKSSIFSCLVITVIFSWVLCCPARNRFHLKASSQSGGNIVIPPSKCSPSSIWTFLQSVIWAAVTHSSPSLTADKELLLRVTEQERVGGDVTSPRTEWRIYSFGLQPAPLPASCTKYLHLKRHGMTINQILATPASLSQQPRSSFVLLFESATIFSTVLSARYVQILNPSKLCAYGQFKESETM